MPQVQTEGRKGILSVLSPQTRAIALVGLIVEAIFGVVTIALDNDTRIWALIICAIVLIVVIGACTYIEISINERDKSDEVVIFPNSMQKSVFVLDPSTQTDIGDIADRYRTASNLKLTGQFTDAIEQYKIILEIDKNHWKSRYNIGSCLIYDNKLDEAFLYFNRLIHDMKERFNNCIVDKILREILHGCYLQLNVILSKKEKYSEGYNALIESLKIIPDDCLTYLNLTISSIKQNNFSEANKWYGILLNHPDQVKLLSSITDEDRARLDSLRRKEKVNG